MDESLICECGNNTFWSFWSYVRCSKCFNEYKRVYEDTYLPPEYLMRRFNKETNQYYNWESSLKTYKNLKIK